jgi:hypothetical protein
VGTLRAGVAGEQNLFSLTFWGKLLICIANQQQPNYDVTATGFQSFLRGCSWTFLLE